MAERDSAQRRRLIMESVQSVGPADVEQLAARFSVTASTIRRDLARLTASGRLVRTYGGAMAKPGPEFSLSQRLGQADQAKRAMAAWASQRIEDGQTVFLDAGSSVAALAQAWPERRDLTVVTASLGVIGQLADRPGLRLECLGGSLRGLSQAFIGPATEAALESWSFDAAFLGADGVSPRLGLCEADQTQARLKAMVVERSQRLYVLAHAAKLGAAPLHAWTRLPRPWTLVTDASEEEAAEAGFDGGLVTVVSVAEPAAPGPEPAPFA
ncbi:MAG: DeoR/GlpR family DNA-binding transcription regulator [Propionibacteriaceae bacterium]|jgi:DeoR/GlpR family transcriptional regulator of sugar metabolism|nr:DeoR/GlpR family DNA-binding transcription regulator [Propionibacteriaceae bacterium]